MEYLVNLSSIYLLGLFGLYAYTFVQEGGRYVIEAVSIDGYTLLVAAIALFVLLFEYPAKRVAFQVKMFFKKNTKQENEKTSRKQVAKKAVNK